jgi:hypothetical protein
MLTKEHPFIGAVAWFGFGGVQPLHNVNQLVPCRVDDTRKRDLAQRRRGAEKRREEKRREEKKRRREGPEKRTGNIEQALSSFAPLRLCASLFLPRHNITRPHVEAAPLMICSLRDEAVLAN